MQHRFTVLIIFSFVLSSFATSFAAVPEKRQRQIATMFDQGESACKVSDRAVVAIFALQEKINGFTGSFSDRSDDQIESLIRCCKDDLPRVFKIITFELDRLDSIIDQSQKQQVASSRNLSTVSSPPAAVPAQAFFVNAAQSAKRPTVQAPATQASNVSTACCLREEMIQLFSQIIKMLQDRDKRMNLFEKQLAAYPMDEMMQETDLCRLNAIVQSYRGVHDFLEKSNKEMNLSLGSLILEADIAVEKVRLSNLDKRLSGFYTTKSTIASRSDNPAMNNDDDRRNWDSAMQCSVAAAPERMTVPAPRPNVAVPSDEDVDSLASDVDQPRDIDQPGTKQEVSAPTGSRGLLARPAAHFPFASFSLQIPMPERKDQSTQIKIIGEGQGVQELEDQATQT